MLTQQERENKKQGKVHDKKKSINPSRIRKEQKNNDCGSGYLQSDVVYYNYRRGDSI